jgi:hypothetical protein
MKESLLPRLLLHVSITQPSTALILNVMIAVQGKDKFENEDLIRYALPQDVWFHVDALSSPHVYLRLPEGINIDTIDPEVIEDCAQLVKAGSIKGNKVNNLDIVYTMASNLRKRGDMDTGTVGFRDERALKKIKIDRRNNDIVNRLKKTEQEAYPDLAAERDAYDKEQQGRARAAAAALRASEKAAKEEAQREKELRDYSRMMRDEDMVKVADLREKYGDNPQAYEDDFM